MTDPDAVPTVADAPAALAALRAPLAPLDEAVASLVRAPGLVAWWAVPKVLPVDGPRHRTDDVVLLEVGAATSLRNRVTRQDLYRTGVSSLRRTLAGLLLDELALRPVWAAEVVLPRADEDRLTGWMRAHLRLGWCALQKTQHADRERRELLGPVTEALGPALREDGEPARSAQARFVEAAGEKPERVVGVPFRRP